MYSPLSETGILQKRKSELSQQESNTSITISDALVYLRNILDTY